jgi:divalent metal cation (Fe/Co/Zn/Cd) transporter
MIEEVINEEPNIELVLNSITLQLGPETMLATKIKMRSGIDLDTAIDSINALERKLKQRIPELKWCFVEPDNSD